MKLISPKSSERWVPLVVFDWKFCFGFYFQSGRRRGPHDKPPFGLWIRLPFVWCRWGAA